MIGWIKRKWPGAKINRVREYDVDFYGILFSLTLYPYQIAFGGTLRWWPTRSIRLHVGPAKIWVGWLAPSYEGTA